MSNRHLLLVDDDPQMPIIVRILARRAELSIKCCPDVESAWHALTDARPDLVLLDVNLPGHNGLELLHRVRKHPTLHDVRVALFCQSGLFADIAAGWAAGADYLVAKELVTRPDDWMDRLREILDDGGGQTTNPCLQWIHEVGDRITTSWGEELNRVREQPPLRHQGAEVMEQLLRRCLTRILGSVKEEWFVPGQGRLVAPALPCPSHPTVVQRIFSLFIDQVRYLLGVRASLECASCLCKSKPESPR
jgi:two-component system phosphate regulon response regulator PhoB